MGSVVTVGNFGITGKLPDIDIGPQRYRKVRRDRLTHKFMQRFGPQIAIMDSRTRVLEYIGVDVLPETAVRVMHAKGVAKTAIQAPTERPKRAAAAPKPAPAPEPVTEPEPVVEPEPTPAPEPVVEPEVDPEVERQAELVTELRTHTKAELLTLAEVHGLRLSTALNKRDIIEELVQLDELDVSLLDDQDDEEELDLEL